MEDYILIEENIQLLKNQIFSIFSTIDGHGGQQFCLLFKQKIIELLKKYCIQFQNLPKQNKPIDDDILYLSTQLSFLELDFLFKEQSLETSMNCGATVSLVIIQQETNKIYSFYLGDCRAIANSFKNKLIYQLSQDHVPDKKDELERIQNIGGIVKHGRLNGKVMISRCFGQFDHKEVSDYDQIFKNSNQKDIINLCNYLKESKNFKSLIGSLPECVIINYKEKQINSLFLTTDGFLTVFKEQEINNMIQNKLINNQAQQDSNNIQDPQIILNDLLKQYKAKDQKLDNAGAILILL